MSTAVNTRQRGVFPYLIAVAALAVPTLAIVLVPLFRERGAFVLYLVTVALTTAIAGWRPALAVIFSSSIFVAWYVLPPSDSLELGVPDAIRLGLYVSGASLITWLFASRDAALKRASAAEQRLAFALDCANMGAWYADLKTGKFWCSEGMERMFGRSNQFSGTYEGFIGYIHPEDQDFVRRAVKRSVEGGEEFEIEHRVVRPNGDVRRIVTRGRIVQERDHRPAQIIGVAVDVTSRKLKEDSV